MPVLGIGIGIIQIFLSYIFYKIDERNTFLTKHSEKSIATFEILYKEQYKSSFQLFHSEISETQKFEESNKKKLFLFRPISHSKAYKIIFITFTIVGFLGVILSTYNLIISGKEAKFTSIKVETMQSRIDSLKQVNLRQKRGLKKTGKGGYPNWID